MTVNHRKFEEWIVCGIAVVFLAVGSLITARLADANELRVDNNRVFEFRVYHAVAGKLPALETRFRDTTSKLLAKHHLNVLGYWVGEDNAFIFMLVHSSREEAKQNWGALLADPEFQRMAKSEQTDKLVEKVDVTYMRPTDFSAMK